MIHINVNNPLYKAFSALRAPIIRILRPKSGYYIAPKKSMDPISMKFGFDRGLPIDRYYIEQFLEHSTQYIQGVCLEVHDDAYLKRYGNNRVTKTDILDIDTTNHLATVYGDLQQLNNIPENSYDCLIITQTFGLIPDVRSAVRECWRILKPGGTILASFSMAGPLREQEPKHWHFTPLSVKTMFEEVFPQEKVTVSSYGNLLVMQSFLAGFAAQELAQQELDHIDPWYPLIISLVATK